MSDLEGVHSAADKMGEAVRSHGRAGIAESAEHELDGLADLPLAEQPQAYQRIHTALQDALADIDDA